MERTAIGIGAAVLGVLVTFGIPVSARRVHQVLPSLLIIVFFMGAAILLLEWPTWLIAGVAACVIAILYRDVLRFIKHAYYDVTKYSRRDYWYRRVGEAVLGGRRKRRR